MTIEIESAEVTTGFVVAESASGWTMFSEPCLVARPTRLARVEDLGYRSLRAFAPWLAFVSVPAVVVRFIIDPGWLPPEFGIGGLIASGLGYVLRWKRPTPARQARRDRS